MTRISVIALAAVFSTVPLYAQQVDWGVKGGITGTSVAAVPDYYDFVLCCHPLFPDARVEPASGIGFVGGAFVAVPISRWLGVQTDVLIARRRHSVDLTPYQNLQVTFSRDYIDTAGLLKLEIPASDRNRIHVAGGPVLSFRIGEGADTSDASLRRGNPDTDVYVVQSLPYAAPELLRSSYASVAIVAGWTYHRFLLEARFTQGLQSIFLDREGVIAGFVKVGGHEPTLRRLIAEFGRSLESAKSRDVAVLAGFRF